MIEIAAKKKNLYKTLETIAVNDKIIQNLSLFYHLQLWSLGLYLLLLDIHVTSTFETSARKFCLEYLEINNK